MNASFLLTPIKGATYERDAIPPALHRGLRSLPRVPHGCCQDSPALFHQVLLDSAELGGFSLSQQADSLPFCGELSLFSGGRGLCDNTSKAPKNMEARMTSMNLNHAFWASAHGGVSSVEKTKRSLRLFPSHCMQFRHQRWVMIFTPFARQSCP